MATPHLDKTDLGTGSGAARYPLICDDDHLLIIRRNTNTTWNNKELIATPDGEWYFCEVTFGEETAANASVNLGRNNADALELQQRLKNMRDGTNGQAAPTAESWVSGQKALFAYWARGFPPYRLKVNTTETIETAAVKRTMELATCFRLLSFNLHAFPIGNCSAFKAYWRVWNPSCALTFSDGWYQTELYSSLHEGAGVLRYKFSSEKQPPNFYQDTTGGYGTADIASVANQRTASGYYAYTTNYNPWNGPATGYQAHKRYVNSSNVNLQYYEDIEITGDGLTSLKNAVKAAATGGDDGHIYAHLGFPITDAQSETSSGQYGQYPHSVIMIIASRVELKIVATWN